MCFFRFKVDVICTIAKSHSFTACTWFVEFQPVRPAEVHGRSN